MKFKPSLSHVWKNAQGAVLLALILFAPTSSVAQSRQLVTGNEGQRTLELQNEARPENPDK